MWLIVISQSLLTSIVYWLDSQTKIVPMTNSVWTKNNLVELSLWTTNSFESTKLPSTANKSLTNEINPTAKIQMQQDLALNNVQLEKDITTLDPNIVLLPKEMTKPIVPWITTFNSVMSWNVHQETSNRLDFSNAIDSQSNQLIENENPIQQKITKELVGVSDTVSDAVQTYNCNILVNEKCSFGLMSASTYQFFSTNIEYISLFLYSNKYELKWLKAWNTKVTVKKNNITYQIVNLNISNELIGKISNKNIIKWTSSIFTVTSWNGNYSLSSSNTKVATVWGSSKYWKVNWVWVGSATITLKDGKWHSASLVVYVLPRELKLSTYSMNIKQWETWYFNIIDGNWNYSVGKNNNNVKVDFNWNTSSFNVVWVSVWQTILNIRDSEQKLAQLVVNVSPNIKPLTLDKTSIDMYIWQTTNFRITSGNWWYIISRNNINVSYSQNWSDTYYNIYWNYAWSSIITVVDKYNQKTQLLVNVINNNFELKLDRTNIEIFQQYSQSFGIISWNGNYNATSSNNSIATVSWSLSSWTVTWINPWNAIITVTDKKGKSAKINVIVKSNPKVSIANIKHTPNVYGDWLGWATFEIVWEASQVWIDYYFSTSVWTSVYDSVDQNSDKQLLRLRSEPWLAYNNIFYTKNLDLQKDNLYSILVDMGCNGMASCNILFKPYVKDLAGKKYYGTENWLIINRKWNHYGKIMAFDSLQVQDVIELNWEFSYEVSNINFKDSTISDSVNDAFGINIYQIGEGISNFVQSNKWIYDGSIAALNDQIQELKAVLDPQTYIELVKQLKLLALQFYDKWFEQFQYLINNVAALGAELLDALKEWFYAVLSLSVYDKQYYSSYFGTVMMISQITSKFPIPNRKFNKLLDKIHEARTKWLKIKLLNVTKVTYAYTKSFIDFVRKVEKFWWDYVKKLDDYILLLDSKFQWTDSYDFIHKLLNNSDAAIKDALDNQQLWIIFYKLQVWKEKLTKHVFEWDISLIGTYRISWVHFKTALKEYIEWVVTHWDVVRYDWVKVWSNNDWDEYFNYNIKAYSNEKYNEDIYNHMIPWDKKWWVYKRWISTFFPDTRTVDKVKAEVEIAFKNLTRCKSEIKVNWVTTINFVYCGKMSDWVLVQFYENIDDLENLSTAFPNLNLELAQ